MDWMAHKTEQTDITSGKPSSTSTRAYRAASQPKVGGRGGPTGSAEPGVGLLPLGCHVVTPTSFARSVT
uniref:Uncharacterized protein n=1 Tax=Arundo donax TaxID=35708 RepID=A0A0A8YKI1_ARUDO